MLILRTGMLRAFALLKSLNPSMLDPTQDRFMRLGWMILNKSCHHPPAAKLVMMMMLQVMKLLMMRMIHTNLMNRPCTSPITLVLRVLSKLRSNCFASSWMSN